MSPLFRKSEEKLANKAAARAEIQRLRALSDNELAVLLLPVFHPEGPNAGTSVRVQQLCQYLLRDFPGAGQLDTIDLMSSARRGVEKLEEAGLVGSISHQRTPVYRITSLGATTLAEGTIEQRVADAK